MKLFVGVKMQDRMLILSNIFGYQPYFSFLPKLLDLSQLRLHYIFLLRHKYYLADLLLDFGYVCLPGDLLRCNCQLSIFVEDEIDLYL
jgi:hypothetical protein